MSRIIEADRRALLAYVIALAASLLVLAASGTVDRKLDVLGHEDFSRIWAGPRALVTGHDPYDPATWHSTAISLGTFPPDTEVYLYPPWVAVALAPLALLPLPLASIVWTAGGLGLAGWALAALSRAYLGAWPIAHAAVATTLVLSGPAISTFLTGQWTYAFIAALSLIALSLRAGRPVLAGLGAVAMLAKPQLFLFAAPALALHALASSHGRAHGYRFMATAVLASAALVGVSAALLPSWWPAWPTYVGNAELGPEHVTIPGLLIRAFGDVGAVLALPVLVGLVLIGLRFDPRAPAHVAVWLAISIAATPYANAYDLLILLVPLVVGTAAIPAGSRKRAALFGLGSAVLLVGATLLHDLGLLAYAPLVPLTLVALLVTALWEHRRHAPADGPA